MSGAYDAISPVLREYVEAVLASYPEGEKPSRVVYAQPGAEVAWDDACDGQLAARIVTIDLVNPQGNASGLLCGGAYWNVRIGLSMVRCIAVVSDRGVAPSAETITEDGLATFRDAAIIQQVVAHLGKTAAQPAPQWLPLGPEGGYAGGEWLFTVRVPFYAVCQPIPWATAEV